MRNRLAMEYLDRNIVSLPALLAGLFCVWIIGGALYRLHFSPLAKFPGPKLAALTLWFETYFDVWHQGKFVFEIKRMHERYGRCFLEMLLIPTFLRLNIYMPGPIVRINPHEIHIDDPDFYHAFYTSSRKLKKYSWYYNVPGVREVSFGTEDHNVHRQRVSAYKDLFSIKSLLVFYPIITANVTKLCKKLDQHAEARLPINLSHEYRVLTLDTITSYIGLGPAPSLDGKHLGQSYREYVRIVTETAVFVRHFRFLACFRFLPQTFVACLSSKFGLIKDHLDVCQYYITRNFCLILE